jgi:predicted AAA+ superfamily ATPase
MISSVGTDHIETLPHMRPALRDQSNNFKLNIDNLGFDQKRKISFFNVFL